MHPGADPAAGPGIPFEDRPKPSLRRVGSGREQLRVLVVDDSPEDRLIIRLLLEELPSGAVVLEEAHDMSSGLAALLERQFDCALVDYRLPDGDPSSLLRMLSKSALRAPPVIVLTGLDDESTALETLHEGAQDFLIKGTVDGRSLLRSMRYAIERSRIKSELERVNGQLERLAFLDPLTEALNRRGLEHILAAELSRADREGRSLFGILIDCDDFKQINDTFGYAAGDEVLRELSRKLAATIRRNDHLGRAGGDEFLILVPGSNLQEATCLAERLRVAIAERPVHLDGQEIPVTVSLGLFAAPPDADSVSDLLTSAEIWLRESKLSGKNRISTASQPIEPSGGPGGGRGRRPRSTRPLDSTDPAAKRLEAPVARSARGKSRR